jgi:hypothetical protein
MRDGITVVEASIMIMIRSWMSRGESKEEIVKSLMEWTVLRPATGKPLPKESIERLVSEIVDKERK